jgi:hypothetical protein
MPLWLALWPWPGTGEMGLPLYQRQEVLSPAVISYMFWTYLNR